MERHMRIAVVHLGRTGAGPVFALELARAIDALGHDASLVYSQHAEIAPACEALESPTLAVSTFATAKGAVTGLARLPSISRQIRAFFDSHQVDGVVVAMEQLWQGLLPGGSGAGRPVLLVVHDAKPHPGEANVATLLTRARERRLAAGALCLSDHVSDRLVAEGIFPSDRVWTTVHPAFRVSESVLPRELPTERPLTVGFFGRMSPYKGLPLGAKAVDELRARGHRVCFHIAGSDVPSDALNLDHPDTVVESRWIPEAEIETVIGAFDVMLLPYVEASQSGVLAYAAAMGIPSVITPVGGLTAQAEAHGGAVVAREVSVGAVADALESLIEDGELYHELSANNLESTATMSWTRTAHDACEALSAIVSAEAG
jgi:glycosyltransferase involved in cell wall biosynthesis